MVFPFTDFSDDVDDDEPDDPRYARIPVWLVLSPASSPAVRLFAFLAAQVAGNRDGHPMAAPSLAEMARVLSKTEDEARGYLQELVTLGALKPRNSGGFRLRFEAPANWTGPRTTAPNAW